MKMKYIALVICALALWPADSAAQLGLAGYLPSECQQKAIETFEGADDAIIISILSIGVTLDIGGADVDLSIDMEKGTAPMWAYAVYSEKLDSVLLVPMLKLLGVCSVAPIEPDNDNGVIDDVALTAVPQDFNEGTQMMGHITSDQDYQAWEKTHPDSTPTFVVLATSEEEFFSFPANSPFWVLQWPAADGTGAFFCISHAESGETICFNQIIASVATEASQAGFRAAPNPASDHVMLTVPDSWLGGNVSVDIVDATGRVYSVLRKQPLSATQIFVPLSDLSNGFWSVRISDGYRTQTIPLSIVR